VINLWAPWRSEYILGEGEASGGCIFCVKPARGQNSFAEELILCATADAFVILNKYPYNNGHLMVVPHAHVTSPTDLAPPALDGLWRLAMGATAALGAALRPAGINLGMNLGRVAGAGIAEHCHVHLVPRWNGDTNFMPVIGETKVISQHLVATYRTLLPRFRKLPGVIASGDEGGPP